MKIASKSSLLLPLLLRIPRSAALMTPSSSVLVVGSANQDLTCVTSNFPSAGETVMGDAFITSCGGKGANQARAAASLLSDRVGLVACLGADTMGDGVRQALTAAGVRLLETKAGATTANIPTGIASILVDASTGNNRIVVVPGANSALTTDAVTAAVQAEKPAVVVAQLEIPLPAVQAALTAGRAVGAITVLNPAPAVELDPSILKQTDLLIPNESEVRTLCGVPTTEEEDETNEDTSTEESLARQLLDSGVRKAVLVTLGARGALLVPRDGPSQRIRPTVQVDRVVDTIGAGDAVCGALAAYLSVASPDSTAADWAAAATKACGLASLSVQKTGATYPARDELPEDLRIDQSAATFSSSTDKPTITFVTGNANKLREVQQILCGADGDLLPYTITNQKIDLPELQGEPADIAKEKCRIAVEQLSDSNTLCIIEDTSLCFHALNGLPGPYVKWFLDSVGHDGLNRMLVGFEDTTAYAQTIVALQDSDDNIHVFEGRTEGKIVPARGDNAFGWDPIFEPLEGKGKTYAEMDAVEKNAISHRGRAFAKVRSFLLEKK